MKCFRAVFASVLFALASSAFAQDSGGMISVQEPDGPLVLTVDQAVEYALEGNLNLKQSATTVYYKEKASHYAWNSVSPSIGVNAGISQVLAEDAKPTYSLGGSLSVRFTPALFSSIKRAAQEYEKEQLSYEDAVRSVELNVRKLFYSILLEEENIVLLESAVNMAKTQYSLSDDATKLGRPEGFEMNVREVYVSAGAGFIVALTGTVMTMPGLSKSPAAYNIDVNDEGKIVGLF